ncbi:MAG TPA: MFS transporter [Usitatibacter sp.]|nr:MFS transporter [Usitatibacter sp.]
MNTNPQRFAIAALCLGVLLPSLGMSIANVALPALSAAFEAPFTRIQWVVVAYLLANTVLVVGAGRLGDVLGRRRLLVAGMLVFAAAGLLCGAAPTLGTLVLARALQGGGAAIMLALSMAMVGETVPKERMGGAMGLLGTMSAVGTAAGPAVGGALVSWLGWRAVFLAAVPVASLAAFIAWRYLPRDAARARAGGGGLASMRAALTTSLGIGLAMSAVVSAVMMATLVVGPFHLTRELGLGLPVVGVVMSIGPIVAALAGLPAGRLVDRFGPTAMVKAGLAGLVAGSAALCAAPVSWGVAGYAVPLAVLTAHYALFQAANNTAVMKAIATAERGVVSGMLNLSRNLGLMAGASAMGSLFAATGIATTFGVASVLLAITLALAFRSAGNRGLTPV